MYHQLAAYQDLGSYIEQELGKNCISPQLTTHHLDNSDVYQIDNLLSIKEIDAIVTHISQYPWQPVGLDGVVGNYRLGNTIGSNRLGSYDEQVAGILFQRIENLLPKQHFHVDSHKAKTDIGNVEEHNQWNFVGFNPYIRYIDYFNHGLVLPHYDGIHSFNPKRRTLMSCLIYLTNNETGKLQFLLDHQDHLNFSERNFKNHTALSNNDIVLEIAPQKGRMVLFDAFLLHQTSEVINEKKMLILSDAIFEK